METGVLIRTVSRGSTAASAKLKSGDLILSLAAKASKENVPAEADDLQDFDDLVERLKDFRPGDVVYLTVVRDFRRAALQLRMFRQLNVPPRNLPKPTQDKLKPGAENPNPGQLRDVPTYRPEVVEVELKGWRDLKTDDR
jgi:hypothetical protein